MKPVDNIKRNLQGIFWKYFWDNFQLPSISIEELATTTNEEIPEIKEHICMPPYFGEESFKDYSYLISIINSRKPLSILELGTAQGNTVANLCLVSNAKIFTVNALPEQIEGNITTYTLTKEEIGSVYRKYGFKDRVVQIFENTKKINIEMWIPTKSVDFAIIDACHDAEFVVNDFFKIFPSLSDHAIVLFHDTHPSIPSLKSHLLDSYLGCMYLRKMGINVKHLTNSSWGVWFASDAKYRQSLPGKIKNLTFTSFGYVLFGGQEKFIQMIRWLASGFLRRKFSNFDNI